MNRIKVLIACFVLSYVLIISTAGEAVEYKIHVLDTVPSVTSGSAYKINDNGLIVGFQTDYQNHVYYWDADGRHSAEITLYFYLTAGVNNAGTIASGPYVRSGNTLSTLPTLDSSPPEYGNMFRDINDEGIIVGSSSVDNMSVQRAAYWDSSGVHSIGTVSNTWANAINNSGQIVGVRGVYPNDTMGFLWSNNTLIDIGLLDGNTGSSVFDINNNGQVVGTSYKKTSTYSERFSKAILWQNGHTTDLLGWSDKSSCATGINDSGQIVGYTVDNGKNEAFFWQNQSLLMLPGLGGNTVAYAINSNGWIVGKAYGSNNISYAVVWEPVPEPSSLIALFSGIVTLSCLKLRRN